jgi:hypothetical protein
MKHFLLSWVLPLPLVLPSPPCRSGQNSPVHSAGFWVLGFGLHWMCLFLLITTVFTRLACCHCPQWCGN